jgi:hypothetical protein
MSARYRAITKGLPQTDQRAYSPYLSSLEINLLVASSTRIASGLEPSNPVGSPTPLKAYFMSHRSDVPVEYELNRSYNSGTHSSVDYDFIEVLRSLVENSDGLPALARVLRGYHKGNSRPMFNKVREMSK